MAAPKTASQSTVEALQARGFEKWLRATGRHLAEAPELDGLTRDPGGSHHRFLIQVPDGWSVASTVRNHWDTWLSWWHYAEHHKQDNYFNPTWIKRHQKNHTKAYFPDPYRLFGQYDQRNVTLRFETLEDDLSEWLGEEVKLRLLNPSKSREARGDYWRYDDETRAFVAQRFEREIEELGYEWPGP